mmetsp:Transcript_28354/g.55761  ORF Transcript_28354/g.55761 Transcript_28354/m.55761 type:complete len:208 (+) Transcript_28354:42-665(+)|eukprot:CAMPEP_0175163116 /NCGR_PEP_ID=MMETSP0087-20121206/25550_1 /TAXON_ID=136419 /ORGANISM="Unknown Unknown, Strain D1" /LENGTH=207 /DNA_ID=CAMNT_0016451743 /DNA_START=26 /DNA_END=649 /DNA_ORIENTATION=+
MNKLLLLVVCLSAVALASNRASSVASLKAKVQNCPMGGCAPFPAGFVEDYIDVPEPPVDAIPMVDAHPGNEHDKTRIPDIDKEIYTDTPSIDFGRKNRGVGMVSAIAMLPDSPAGLRGNIILTHSEADKSSFPADEATTVGNPCDCADKNSQGCKKFECGEMHGTRKGTDYSTLTMPGAPGHTTCKCPAGVHCPCFGCNRCTSQFGQ